VADARGDLLSVVALDAAIAVLVLAVFWASVTLMRFFGSKARYSLAPLGFSRPKGGILAGIGAGVAVGVFAILLGVVVNPLSKLVLERLGYSIESRVQRPFMEGLSVWVRDDPSVAVPAIVLVVVFFGPAVEELVFRGVVFNGLYRLGTRISTSYTGKEGLVPGKAVFAFSALASSVLFALLHLEPLLAPVLLILAVILCDLFRRTESLLPPIVAHATFNSLATSIIILDGLGVLDVPI